MDWWESWAHLSEGAVTGTLYTTSPLTYRSCIDGGISRVRDAVRVVNSKITNSTLPNGCSGVWCVAISRMRVHGEYSWLNSKLAPAKFSYEISAFSPWLFLFRSLLITTVSFFVTSLNAWPMYGSNVGCTLLFTSSATTVIFTVDTLCTVSSL